MDQRDQNAILMWLNKSIATINVTLQLLNIIYIYIYINELHIVKNHLHKCVEICKMYNNGQACFILEGRVSITS